MMDSWAAEALEHYGLAVQDVEFIRHNENRTYRVRADGKVYVLRIHLPQAGFSLKIFNSPHTPQTLKEGEAQLLNHLGKQAGFPIQTPVPTREGKLLCSVAGGASACLLRWLEGEPLSKETAPQYAGQLGELAARLHDAARGFTGKRYQYGHELLISMGRELAAAREQGHILAGQEAVCQRALQEIEKVMTRLDGEKEAKSLIHADLGWGNVLLTPRGLAPIDFSLSGYGYRAQECGMLASNFAHSAQWEEIRLAYERASGVAIFRWDQDAFLALSVLLFVACQHDRFWQEPWFSSRMAAWCSGCVLPDTWRY